MRNCKVEGWHPFSLCHPLSQSASEMTANGRDILLQLRFALASGRFARFMSHCGTRYIRSKITACKINCYSESVWPRCFWRYKAWNDGHVALNLTMIRIIAFSDGRNCLKIFFYIRGSVHRESNLITVQQYATVFSLLRFCRQLYMFRVLTPVIRSSYNCNYSYWYWSNGSTNIRFRCWVGTDS